MALQDILDKFDGLDVDKFDHIPEISHYNSNYYNCAGSLLYCDTGHDDSSDWYLIRGDSKPLMIGYSTCLDHPEVIYTDECYRI